VIIFFLVAFSVYGALNFYVGLRGWQALPDGSPYRILFLILFLFLVLSYIAGRFLERAWHSILSDALIWIGSYWLAAMVYFLLAALLVDLFRLVYHFIPFLPGPWIDALRQGKIWILGGVMTAVALLLAFGHWNAATPRLRQLDLYLRRPLSSAEPVRVVVASDIHLGTIIGAERFGRIVEMINGCEPDLILFPGDIVDEDLAPVIRANLGEGLRSLRARYGIYAVTGNHEYIGGAEAACAYLEEHGVRVLRDSVVRLPDGLQIVGREDRAIRQFSGRTRRPLAELMAQTDSTRPVVLMDHQPFHLEEGAGAGVDLQLSGHTHHGQLWPFNHITELIYEISRGYGKVGETHVYVSSGVGTWGPPVRLGNTPEVVLITLRSPDARGR
jgi:uncharacterized protein